MIHVGLETVLATPAFYHRQGLVDRIVVEASSNTMNKSDYPERRRSLPSPYKSGELASLIAKLLAKSGPMSAKEIKLALRSEGQPYVDPSAINKILRTDLASSVVQRDGKWELTADR